GRFLEAAKRDDDARALYTRFLTQESLAPVCQAGLARIAAGTVPDPLVGSAQQGAAEALFGIGTSLSDQSSTDTAVLYLRLALYLDPHHDLARLVLADRYENLQKYDDAIATYRDMDHDGPYWPAASVQAAVDLGKLKRYDEAVSELQRLAKDRPDDLAVWTALGDIYRDEEKYTEAADAYDRAIKTLNPVADKDWPLFYARAVSEERSKQWPDAERDLLQALKLSPDQPQVLNYLGYSWVDQGKNLAQALAMLEKARTLSPYDGYIVDSVGWAYFRLGRYDMAVKTLEDAVLLVPGDATINDHLGDAYWKAGRKVEARYQWSNALAFDPDAKEKAAIELKLKSGLALADGSGD
ncbi:MAG TPA: tetratricopeptide repeat protein, partial [Candidatus Binataceae bacterium]|nr:tetratricopeptide repeat protein [Candidatus Binataceae bacterium]